MRLRWLLVVIKISVQCTVFGIVSNGKYWEFGKLEKTSFTQNNNRYLLQDLEQLFAAVNYVFKECELQLDAKLTV
jgi:hypothetical protein